MIKPWQTCVSILILFLIGVATVILDQHGKCGYMVVAIITIGMIFSVVWGTKRIISTIAYRRRYYRDYVAKPLIRTYSVTDEDKNK